MHNTVKPTGAVIRSHTPKGLAAGQRRREVWALQKKDEEAESGSCSAAVFELEKLTKKIYFCPVPNVCFHFPDCSLAALFRFWNKIRFQHI